MKVVNKEKQVQKQNEKDKDEMIANLSQELADTKLQVSDMAQILAEMQIGGAK